MRTTAFEEYPHETALRFKREAGPDLYDALAGVLDALNENMISSTAVPREPIIAALAKARGEA